MKKLVKIMIIIVMVLTMTGCVRYNANMDIKRDKSMEFSVIYALDTSYFGEKNILSDDELKHLEENGYEIEGYSNGNYKGATIKKKYKNIDLISTTSNVEYKITGITTQDIETSKYLFKIEKGLFKNKYIANFIFNPSDSSLKTSEIPIEEGQQFNEVQYNNIENQTETSQDIEIEDDSIGAFSEMDLMFSINLPYSAVKNNATTTTNKDKTLKWILSSEQESKIEFEFEIYNKTSMYILIGIIAITVLSTILLIIAILIKKKKESQEMMMPTYIMDQNIQQTMYMDPTTGQTYTVPSQMMMPTYGVQPTDVVQYDPITGTTYIIQTDDNNDPNNQNNQNY